MSNNTRLLTDKRYYLLDISYFVLPVSFWIFVLSNGEDQTLLMILFSMLFFPLTYLWAISKHPKVYFSSHGISWDKDLIQWSNLKIKRIHKAMYGARKIEFQDSRILYIGIRNERFLPKLVKQYCPSSHPIYEMTEEYCRLRNIDF